MRLAAPLYALLLTALLVCACGPSEEELRRERYGIPKLESKVIRSKEKTAKGNYFFRSTDGKYCKLGASGFIAPPSDFERLGKGDRYECFWKWEKYDF